MWLYWAVQLHFLMLQVSKSTLCFLLLNFCPKFEWCTFCPKIFGISHHCFVDDNELQGERSPRRGLVSRANGWIHPGGLGTKLTTPKTVIGAIRKLRRRHPYQQCTLHRLQIQQSISLEETYDNYEARSELSIKAVCDNRHLSKKKKNICEWKKCLIKTSFHS